MGFYLVFPFGHNIIRRQQALITALLIAVFPCSASLLSNSAFAHFGPDNSSVSAQCSLYNFDLSVPPIISSLSITAIERSVL